MCRSRTTHGSEATVGLGAQLARRLRPRDVVLLAGPLGAGKSTLAAGIGRELGVRRWRGSPTFTLVNEYATTPPLIHLDLYRLDPEGAEDLGLEEYLENGSVLLVEWPERAEAYLAQLPWSRLLTINMQITGEVDRLIGVKWLPRQMGEVAAG